MINTHHGCLLFFCSNKKQQADRLLLLVRPSVLEHMKYAVLGALLQIYRGLLGFLMLSTTIHRFDQKNNQNPPIRTFGDCFPFPDDHRPDLTSGRFCGKLTG